MAGAVETVIATIQLGVPVARIELMDETQMDAVNRYSKTSYAVAPTLFFEFHSDSDGARRRPGENRPGAGRRARRPRFPVGDAARGSREAVARASRHACTPRSRCVRARARRFPTSACRFRAWPSAFSKPSRTTAGAPFPIALVGHAGDGNFHLLFILDVTNPAELDASRQLNERLVMRALRLGGTCTGEHGVGHRQDEISRGRARIRRSRSCARSSARWIPTTG